MKLNDFVGKEVQLYPGDTLRKFGIIEEITEKGIVIRITEVGSSCTNEEYKVGDIYFISYSANLTFKLETEEE